MKKSLLVIAILLATATFTSVIGQSGKEVKLLVNKQIAISGTKLMVKLIEVKDTRCPADVNCVWAGNAIVKISIIKGKSAAKMLELNTGIDPRNVIFEGYEITLGEVTPLPKSSQTVKPNDYFVKISLVRISKKK
jgi:hypothetical protein